MGIYYILLLKGEPSKRPRQSPFYSNSSGEDSGTVCLSCGFTFAVYQIDCTSRQAKYFILDTDTGHCVCFGLKLAKININRYMKYEMGVFLRIDIRTGSLVAAGLRAIYKNAEIS